MTGGNRVQKHCVEAAVLRLFIINEFDLIAIQQLLNDLVAVDDGMVRHGQIVLPRS